MVIHQVKSNSAQAYAMDANTRSNEYLKRNPKADHVHGAYFNSSLSSMKVVENIEKPVAAVAAADTNKKGFLQSSWDWIQNKWNSLLIGVGLRSAPVPIVNKERPERIKQTERTSPHETDEDFKWIDITQMDPVKALMAILAQHAKLHQDGALLATQQIRLAQATLNETNKRQIEYKAQIAVIDKDKGILDKIGTVLTGAQIVAFVVSSLAVVAGAATIATGGAAAPAFAIVMGSLSALTSGGKAANTWFKGRNEKAMNALQSNLVGNDAERSKIQIQLKISIQDVKAAFDALGDVADSGQAVLAAQYDKKN